ncbi:MAG: PH domain-containing protein [Muribaculaceae bacterium]|nr:PH domain-containing protein [Muribaculaceae bacterium]
MDSKVKLSTFSLILTIIIIGVLLVGTAILYNEGNNKWGIAAAILLILLIFGLLYGPTSISVADKNVTVKTFLKRIKLPISKIESVELFQPTMGAIRIFGSGGFMGHWGFFKEGDIGQYTAFYGKSSDCFLVKMKNGDKYVLGCENSSQMVNYIKSQM